MIPRLSLSAAGLALGLAAAQALEGAPHDMGHMSMRHEDNRQLLDFPGPMRDHMLTNMRGHLEALGEITAALGAGDGAQAAKIAEGRLGLGSPGAGACVKGEAAGGMAAMMARHMPQDMRELGAAMHQSASDFARTAAAMGPNGDLRPSLAALSKVTEACAACHSAYRLK